MSKKARTDFRHGLDVPGGRGMIGAMNVYYNFALQQIEEYEDRYREVLGLIRRTGHELTRDWLDDALKRKRSGESQPPRSEQYLEIMAAIREADACIFDVTVKSMSIGMQLMYALDQRKPTLVMADSRVSSPVRELLVAGSRSGYLRVADYRDDVEMAKLVNHFLAHNDPRSRRVRFQLAMDAHVADFVEKEAYETGMSKTDVIVRALEAEMEARDGSSHEA